MSTLHPSDPIAAAASEANLTTSPCVRAATVGMFLPTRGSLSNVLATWLGSGLGLGLGLGYPILTRLLKQGAGHLRDEEVEAEAVDPDVELAAELTERQAVDALLEHLVRGRVRVEVGLV